MCKSIDRLMFLPVTFALMLSTVLLASFCPSANAADAPAYQLRNERWVEHAYGLSLLPPANTIQLNNTSDGSLVKFNKPDQYLLSVKMLSVDKLVELGDIARTADLKFLFAYPSAVPTKDELFKVGDHIEALQRYMYVPDKENGDWIFGQTFIKVDPITFAMIDFECKANDFDTYTPIYNEVCQSIQLATAEELDTQRIQLVDNGQKLREMIDLPQCSDLLVPEQWFRLVQNDKEIGYMRMKQFKEKQLGRLGIRIEVNATADLGTQQVNVKQDYFETLDRSFEVWSSKKTIKHPDQSFEVETRNNEIEKLPEATSTAITGTRTGSKLTVTIDKDADIKTLEWEIPKEQYLSMIERTIMLSHYPKDAPIDFAFYGFDHTNEKLSLMIGQITPTGENNGSYWLDFLPGLDASPTYSCFNAKGELLRQELPDGLILIPSTIEQIRMIHQK